MDPISKLILFSAETRPVTVVHAESDPGLTPTLVRTLIAAGWGLPVAQTPRVPSGRIVCTQPRGVLGRTLHRSLLASGTSASEALSPEEVFLWDEQTGRKVNLAQLSPQYKVCILSETALLRELLRDPRLPTVACIVFDHCDEPSLVAEILIPLCKKLCFARMRETRRSGTEAEPGPMKLFIPMRSGVGAEYMKSYFDFDPASAMKALQRVSEQKASEREQQRVGFIAFPRPQYFDGNKVQVIYTQPAEHYLRTILDILMRIQAGEIKEPREASDSLARRRGLSAVKETPPSAEHAGSNREEQQPGDVLVLLPGAEESQVLADLVQESLAQLHRTTYNQTPLNMIMLPIYERSGLAGTRARNVFVGTAEAASLSHEAAGILSNLSVIVDSGFTKQTESFSYLGKGSVFSSFFAQRFTTISQVPASKFQLAQRALLGLEWTAPGRVVGLRSCGRLVIRVFDEDTMQSLTQLAIPEIHRSDITRVPLVLRAFGVTDLAHFDWLHPPHPNHLGDALTRLVILNALRPSAEDEQSWVQAEQKSNALHLRDRSKPGDIVKGFGDVLAELPIDPRLGTMLLKALDADLEMGQAAAATSVDLHDTSFFEAALSLVALLAYGSTSARGVPGFQRNLRFLPSAAQLKRLSEQLGTQTELDDEELAPHLSLAAFEGDHLSALSALTTFELILTQYFGGSLDRASQAAHASKEAKESPKDDAYQTFEEFMETYRGVPMHHFEKPSRASANREGQKSVHARRFYEWCNHVGIDMKSIRAVLGQRKVIRTSLSNALTAIGSKARAKLANLRASGQGRIQMLTSWRTSTKSRILRSKLVELLVASYFDCVLQRMDDQPAETLIGAISGVSASNMASTATSLRIAGLGRFNKRDNDFDRSEAYDGEDSDTRLYGRASARQGQIASFVKPTSSREEPTTNAQGARYVPFGMLHSPAGQHVLQNVPNSDALYFRIHPSSVLHGFSPKLIIFTGPVIASTHMFVTHVSTVPSPEFLAEAVPQYYARVSEAELSQATPVATTLTEHEQASAGGVTQGSVGMS